MIKPEIIAAINRYAYQHVPTGSFLKAVLSNDLIGACGHADPDNAAALDEIVKYIYNEIPGDCWGSPAIVQNWLSKGIVREMPRNIRLVGGQPA